MGAEASTLLVILAKRPRLGGVKTRLAVDTGPDEALAIYQRLLQIQIDHARAFTRAAPGRSARIDWDQPDASAVRAVPEVGWCEDGTQGTGSIGDRMDSVVQRHFHSRDHACNRLLIVGSDCPYLNEHVLAAAEAALHDADCVLVPALDGGYVLIGVNAKFADAGIDVFEGMPWSRPELMAATRERLKTSCARWTELPPLEDIDDWPALQRWQAAATGAKPSAF